jgi:hypothetical protein
MPASIPDCGLPYVVPSAQPATALDWARCDWQRATRLLWLSDLFGPGVMSMMLQPSEVESKGTVRPPKAKRDGPCVSEARGFQLDTLSLEKPGRCKRYRSRQHY